MKITLKDGSVFEGTAEEYAELAKLVEGLSETKDEYVPKVGDYVVALPSADEKYNITNSEMRLGKVKDVQGDIINIEILKHSRSKAFVGEELSALSKYFRKATEEEKEKYYAKLNKSEFKAGDYARIKLGVTHDGYAGGGDIVKLYDNSGGYYDFKVVKLGGNIVDEYSFFDACDLEKVSEEELKFAKLGRKPGEFKKGDIFKGVGGRVSRGLFEVVEIREEGSHPIRFINRDGENDGFSLKAELELIAPVESRVDLDD